MTLQAHRLLAEGMFLRVLFAGLLGFADYGGCFKRKGAMKHFHISLDLSCPSEWNEVRIREYVERCCLSSEDKHSIAIDGPRCYSPVGQSQNPCILPEGHEGACLWIYGQ